MATLLQQKQRIQLLKEEVLSDQIFKFIKSVEDKLVKLNVDQINKDSSDINGKPIGFYSYATELITNGRKAQGQPFDGRDTGDWLESFFVSIENDKISFGATDAKTLTILTSDNWLSSQLFGLTEENQRQFIRKELLPFVLKYQREVLGI